MNLRPLHDRVLVRRLEEQETKRGGIIIPDSAKEKPQHAEVMAVGSGKLLEDGNRAVPDVKAGDKILFGKYSGSDIRIDGDEYLILREDGNYSDVSWAPPASQPAALAAQQQTQAILSQIFGRNVSSKVDWNGDEPV